MGGLVRAYGVSRTGLQLLDARTIEVGSDLSQCRPLEISDVGRLSEGLALLEGLNCAVAHRTKIYSPYTGA